MPELTASSPVINGLAVYQGNTVVIVPLDEYKQDNVRIERLINTLEQCHEVDSVKDLRIVNYQSIITAQDTVAEKQAKQLGLSQNKVFKLEEDLLAENKKKRQWRTTSLISLAAIVVKVFLFN